MGGGGGGASQQKSFTTLEAFLVSSGVMAALRLDRPFKLYTDASDYVIGAILVQQEDDQVERVVQYISHALSPTQRRWTTIKRSVFGSVCLRQIKTLFTWRRMYYIYRSQAVECTIYTDHKPWNVLYIPITSRGMFYIHRSQAVE